MVAVVQSCDIISYSTVNPLSFIACISQNTASLSALPFEILFLLCRIKSFHAAATIVLDEVFLLSLSSSGFTIRPCTVLFSITHKLLIIAKCVAFASWCTYWDCITNISCKRCRILWYVDITLYSIVRFISFSTKSVQFCKTVSTMLQPYILPLEESE